MVVVARLTSAEGAEAEVGHEEAQKKRKSDPSTECGSLLRVLRLFVAKSFFPRQLDGFVFR